MAERDSARHDRVLCAIDSVTSDVAHVSVPQTFDGLQQRLWNATFETLDVDDPCKQPVGLVDILAWYCRVYFSLHVYLGGSLQHEFDSTKGFLGEGPLAAGRQKRLVHFPKVQLHDCCVVMSVTGEG